MCTIYIFQHPWMVSIQTSDGFLHCGGSIAASDRIITAAHCFTNQVKKQKMSKLEIQSLQVVAGADAPFEPLGESTSQCCKL